MCEECRNMKPKPRQLSDLTVDEAFGLMVKAVKECKRQDAEKAEIEYRKLNGTKVPLEY